MRQYIGARYVPKFEGTWSGSRTYEALSVVTYNGDSYTSKKPVPVGVAPTNGTYWALTGAYNSQVEEYRQLAEDTAETVGRLTKKKFVFVGDSYGAKTNGWIDKLIQFMNLTGSDYYRIAENGAGLVHANGSGHTFISLLNMVYGSITDPESITDIIIAGGTNDFYNNDVFVESDVYADLVSAVSQFPNAKCHLAYIGMYDAVDAAKSERYRIILNFYKNQCGAYGAGLIDYMFNSEHIMHKSMYIDGDDHIHPTTYGDIAIARALANGIMSGNSDSYEFTQISVSAAITGSFAALTTGTCEQVNNQIFLTIPECQINTSGTLFEASNNNEVLHMLNLTGSSLLHDRSGKHYHNIHFMYTTSDEAYWHPAQGRIQIDGDQIIMLNDTGADITFQNIRIQSTTLVLDRDVY